MSDNIKERVDVLKEKYDFINWFYGGVFSFEVGIRKPNPAIYKLALDKAGVKPNEAVYIDDKESFLKPAIELGMKVFLYKNSVKLRNDLHKAKILDM